MPDDLPSTDEILQRLHDSEINVAISCFFDEGFRWDIGDDLNGWKMRGKERTPREAVLALAEAVFAEQPRSDFAAWWKDKRKST